MTNKQITIDTCPYQGDCSISGCIRNDDDCFISFSADLEKVREKSSFIQTENLFCLEDDEALELFYSLLKEKSTIFVNL